MPYPRSASRLCPLLLALLLAAVVALPAAARDAVLVADVEPSGDGWQEDFVCHILCPPPPVLQGSHPGQLTAVGDLLYFSAFDFDHGRELWVSDGTAAGTRLVADLCPGECSSNPVLHGGLDGRLYFWAADRDVEEGPDSHGFFWSTDGTAAGTRRLDEVCDQPCYQERQALGVVFDDALFFIGPPAGADGVQTVLWRTDGSAEGTGPVRYLPGPLAEPLPVTVRFADSVAVVGDELFVVRSPELFSQQRSVLLRLRAGEEMPRPVVETCERFQQAPGQFRASGARVAFVSDCLARPGLRVSEPSLFLTDGTKAGTRLLFDGRRSLSETVRPVVLGWWRNQLFFAVNDEAGDSAELWVSHGTVLATFQLLDGLPPISGGFVHGERVVLESSTVEDGLTLLTYHPDLPAAPQALAPAGVRDLTVLGRHLLFSTLDAEGREPWVSDGTVAGTRRLADLNPGPADSNPQGFAAGDRVYFSADDGIHDRELWAFPRSVVNPDTCLTGGDTLCLADGRFRVRVRFRNQHAGGAEGVGKAVPGTPKAGFFWFFRQDNLELMVKVLDGTSVNGHHWVFYGGITNLEYDLEVTDLVSGETRTYHHAPGDLCGGSDTRAFPATEADGATVAASSVPPALATSPPVAQQVISQPSPLTPPPCGSTDTRLCLGVWQFMGVEVTYRNQYAGGAEGPGMAVPMTGDSGWFWFFNENNPEVMVKVLDGTPVNGHTWVFIGGLSTVEYEVTVTSAPLYGGGESKTYVKPAGSTCGIADTTAFGPF